MKRSLLAAVVSASLTVAFLPTLGSVAEAVAPREGWLDTSFGGDGKTFSPFSQGDVANSIALQPDGKVVVGGSYFNGSISRAIFMRLTPSGNLDKTFSGDGIATPPIGAAGQMAVIRDIAIQPNGKIVAVGHVDVSGHNRLLAARLNPGGALDPTFNGTGWRATSVAPDGSRGLAMALEPDGRIVAVGRTLAGTQQRVAVVRYRPNGSLDPTFSGDGKAAIAVGVSAMGQAVKLQPDGKIVIAGDVYPTSEFGPVEMLTMRLKPGGALDTTFSGDGHAASNFGGSDSEAYDVVIDPAGRILIGGQMQELGASTYNAMLIRYRPNGTPDTSFGSNGVVAEDFGPFDWITSLALQPDGRIVAGGEISDGSQGHGALLRFTPNGFLDGAFAGGVVSYQLGDDDAFNDIALQRNGRIVAAGFATLSSKGVLTVDRVLGDKTPPYDGRLIGLPRWSLSRSLALDWTASDDNTGVKSYDVRYRSAAYNSGSYGGFHAFRSGTALTHGTFKASPGHTYCLSVRARDFAGNVGPYGDESCAALPVDDRTARASTGWTKLSGRKFYLGTARTSTTRGSTLTLGIRYRHLALIVTKCPGCGSVRVMLGSTTLATVKLGARRTHNRVIVPIDSSLAVSAGTLTIKQVSRGHRTTIDGIAVSLV